MKFGLQGESSNFAPAALSRAKFSGAKTKKRGGKFSPRWRPRLAAAQKVRRVLTACRFSTRRP
ncbi:MAG: hypothetical protein DBY30_04975 [Verrucomicrobia bacterium]|nr:MAG: hypothetical protein DBY30_04975 [Verrucomicrobiota bacterium]